MGGKGNQIPVSQSRLVDTERPPVIDTVRRVLYFSSHFNKVDVSEINNNREFIAMA